MAMVDQASADPAWARSLVELRRDLHRHPELRFTEHRTAALLAERLDCAGFDVRRGVGGTGVLAVIEGSPRGPHVALRADMDAMPVHDEKTVPYASSVPGVTHACGHDVHMAVVCGVAERIAAAGMARGRLTVILQPAEERPFGQPSGAEAMIADGALDPLPDAILGLHCWPELPAGIVGVDQRIAMGAKDAFRVVVRGEGAHAATPSRGRDAVLALAGLITGLHASVGRSRDAADRLAFNIGTIAGGRSQSVVPDTAELTGTLRTVDPDVRSRMRAIIERTVAGSAAASGVAMDLAWADEMPPVRNDAELVERSLRVGAVRLGGDAIVRLTDPPMTADDFALLAERAPSLYVKLGVSDRQPWPALHSGAFDVDERCIVTGVEMLHALAEDLLRG